MSKIPIQQLPWKLTVANQNDSFKGEFHFCNENFGIIIFEKKNLWVMAHKEQKTSQSMPKIKVNVIKFPWKTQHSRFHDIKFIATSNENTNFLYFKHNSSIACYDRSKRRFKGMKQKKFFLTLTSHNTRPRQKNPHKCIFVTLKTDIMDTNDTNFVFNIFSADIISQWLYEMNVNCKASDYAVIYKQENNNDCQTKIEVHEVYSSHISQTVRVFSMNTQSINVKCLNTDQNQCDLLKNVIFHHLQIDLFSKSILIHAEMYGFDQIFGINLNGEFVDDSKVFENMTFMNPHSRWGKERYFKKISFNSNEWTVQFYDVDNTAELRYFTVDLNYLTKDLFQENCLSDDYCWKQMENQPSFENDIVDISKRFSIVSVEENM